MTFKNLALVAFAVFTVTLNTACPRDIANDVAEQDQLLTEYNQKVRESNDIVNELDNNYNVRINKSGSVLTSLIAPDWMAKSATDRAIIRTKLNKYIELRGRMIEIAQHKNFKGKTTEPVDINSLRAGQDSAKSFLDSLDAAEAKAGAAAKTDQNSAIMKSFNDKTDETGKISSELLVKHKMLIGKVSLLQSSFSPDWKSLTPVQRTEIREKLNRYIAVTNELIALASDPQVANRNSEFEPSKLKDRAECAQWYLDQLDKSESKSK